MVRHVSRMRRSVSEASGAPLIRDRYTLGVWNGPGSATHRHRPPPAAVSTPTLRVGYGAALRPGHESECVETARARLRMNGDGCDFDLHIARQARNLDGGAGGRRGLEVRRIDLVHLAEFVEVLEKDRR
jgi:hypothetical protein